MDLIEDLETFSTRYSRWTADDKLKGYPFVENIHSPFTPVRRALPMLNLALITSAGAYIDGTDRFETESKDGDMSFREIPVEVEAVDLRYAAKGYDTAAVLEDRNVQIPVDRLLEYQSNGVIGGLNNVWWSLSSHIPNAERVATELAPAIADRLARYDIHTALFIPASRLCHQTLGIVARAVELAGIPTMTISVDARLTDKVRPPRTAYYTGEFGSVAGKPNWREHQLRILDEALRWTETFDQPGSRKLNVEQETAVEASRGER
ncbi:MAG: glycine/sarcosine/betaine reductase selenoprotein B family protein [Pyrinomonadaceae bacterium]